MKILITVEDILFGSAISALIVRHQWPENTEFRIIHIVEPFLINDSSHAPFAKLMELSGQQIIGAATRTVEEIAQAIQDGLPGVTVSKHVIEGHVNEQIVSIAADWPADLIIAGSHGRSGFNRLFLGSVSLMLVCQAPCPLLLIKPNASTLKIWESINTFSSSSKVTDAVKGQESRRVLIALDDTDISDQMIDFVIGHYWTQPAHFKALSVVRKPHWLELQGPELADMYQDSLNSRKATLRKQALKLRDHFHSPHIEEEVIEGDPKKAIVAGAEKWGADLIVLGCHFKKTLQNLSLGSVSLAVLCTSPCSVLVLRQKPELVRTDMENKELQIAKFGKIQSTFAG